MIRTDELITLHVSHCSIELYLEYLPKTSRALFDICDENGRIIKTGLVHSFQTRIEISDLENSKYVLLILDGDRISSQSFTVSR